MDSLFFQFGGIPKKFAILVSLFTVAGCISTVRESGAPDPEADQSIYAEIGVKAPVWRRLRAIPTDDGTIPDTVSDVTPYDVSDQSVSASDKTFLRRLSAAADNDAAFSVVAGNFDTGYEYLVEFDHSAVERVAAYTLRQAGQNASQEENDVEMEIQPDFVPKGLSNANDNRARYGIADGFSVWNQSLRRIGQVGGSCTGTLIDNRLVITAAHCFFGNGNTSLNFNTTFTPRRDGNTTPYGAPSIYTYWYPTAWFNNDCHITYTGATAGQCVPFDWVILVLKSNPWSGSTSGSPGWMGFWYASANTVNSWYQLNKGYALCSGNFTPPNCLMRLPYGSTTNCGPAQFIHPRSEWPVKLSFGTMRQRCDTSPGHSGGPIYSYSPGSNGPYVTALTVWNSCWTNCTTSSTYSSEGPRITKHLGDWLLNLRNMY